MFNYIRNLTINKFKKRPFEFKLVPFEFKKVVFMFKMYSNAT